MFAGMAHAVWGGGVNRSTEKFGLVTYVTSTLGVYSRALSAGAGMYPEHVSM